MRIIGGRLGGLRLASVGKGDEAARLRPTPDRVRESLFNRLEGGHFGDPIPGAVVLDLFAGTGALGLEAMSRGAASCVFVDSGRVAARLLAENLRKADLGPDAQIVRRDAAALGRAHVPPATLVFLDPPYGQGLGIPALGAAVLGGWVAPGALVVWEEDAPQAAPPGFERLDARKYGTTHVTWLRAASPEA